MLNIKTICLLTVILFQSLASAQTTSISVDKFVSQNNLYSMTSSTFAQQWGKAFKCRWSDKMKSSARSVAQLSFKGLVSKETIFRFKNGKFFQLTMMLYNQGDEGTIRKSHFEKKIITARDTMRQHLGKGSFKPNAGPSKINIYFWVKLPHLYKLEYAHTFVKGRTTKSVFKGEFVRLSVLEGNNKIDVINIDKAGKGLLGQQDVRKLVTREQDGTVILNNIPMVDQGKKGYCACATTARILNFYGREIDQHDIAKMALSSGDMGTDPKELSKAIKKISSILRLNMKTVATCYLASKHHLGRLIKKIGQVAKRKGITPGSDRRWKTKDLVDIFQDLSLKDRRFKDFKKNIKTSIDRGHPLAWGLLLGIIPEKEIPQASGGHMRIIMGYNEKTSKIFYTDSWGAGHEKKEMDMATAFFISIAVWDISPR